MDIQSIDMSIASIETGVRVIENSATILFYGVIGLIILVSILV